MPVPQRIAHNTPDHTRPEIVGIVEAIDGSHHLFARQAGIFDMRELMTAAVRRGLARHEIVAGELTVQFRSGVGMSNGYLYRFRIQFFCKIERTLDRFACFAGQPDDEVTVDSNAYFFAVFRKFARLLDRCAFLDVFQDLRIA